MVNFLLQLRLKKRELLSLLSAMPSSRYLYEQFLHAELPEDPVARAAVYFYKLRHSIVPSTNVKAGYRAGKIKSTAEDYANVIKRLELLDRRFERVNIECLDFREVIRRYDGPATLFYIDSPYRKKEKYYKGNFSDADHVELSRMLSNIQGKALVSYYGDPLILELYRDWNVYTANTSHVGGVVKVGQTRSIAEEFFFTNYEPPILL
jgi:DNA adenine methylase